MNNKGLGVATLTKWDFIVNGDTLVSLPYPTSYEAQQSSQISEDFDVVVLVLVLDLS